MPASLPGDTNTNNRTGNPAAGQPITFDLLSGPKGSPFDKDAAGNASTGALSTGIGFGAEVVIGLLPLAQTGPTAIAKAGFTDDYTPGASKLDGSAATDSRFMYIGGGKSSIVSGTGANGNGWSANTKASVPAPYTAGFGIGGAGNSGSRDAGAGPAYTGFALKTVTAAAGVAAGAAVETGFTNRAGVALTTGQSTFGSSTSASAAVA
jgi:hypothetical protein